jgi:asparagine synthetase B (glutamine-hydrolysing)
MCGIAGVTTFNSGLNKEKFIESVELLKSRGPDSQGFFMLVIAR